MRLNGPKAILRLNRAEPVILEFFIAESSKDKYAWDALKLIAEQHLRDREPLPDALADWLADWLAGKIQRPPGLLN